MLQVTRVRTQVVNLGFRNCILVAVETNEGITGVSETVMKRNTLAIEKAIVRFGQYLAGKDPTDIEDHWEKMYRDSFWVGGPMHATAISAIDCALWDILGKRLGVPVYKLLGGPTRRRVPVYCHCPSGPTPEDFARNVKSAVRKGFRAVKTTLPLFYGGGDAGASYSGTRGAIDPSLKETEYLPPSVFWRIKEFFAAARDAAGPEVGLAVDCHGRLGLKSAIRLCHVLDDLGLMFVEEPVPPENAALLARVQQESQIPIAAGERWATIHGVRPFLDQQAVDILQCDLVNCGGVTALKKIAAMAESSGISMAPHNPNGPVATMMNLQMAACIPNYYQLEVVGSDADRALWEDLLGHPFPLEDGALPIPSLPGYGVSLDEAAVARRPYVPQAGWR